jgi:uncharacterized membrane protein
MGDEPHAIMWDAETGAMQELAGVTSFEGETFASAINEHGVVVGNSDWFSSPWVTASGAFIWENGAVTDVGLLKNFDMSLAIDINSAGQVVGYCYQWKTGGPGGSAGRGFYRAFLWEQGELSDLNDLIPDGTSWVLRQARGISDNGMIVGNGTLNDESRGFMLVPRG